MSRALPLSSWAKVNHQRIMYIREQKRFVTQENLTGELSVGSRFIDKNAFLVHK